MDVLDDTFMAPGLDEVRRAGHHCPRCVWPYLQPVDSVDQPHWLCESCGHCWRLEHDRLRPVNVLGCRGCTRRPKRDCIALMQREFPRFGAGAAAGDDLG